MIIIAHSVCSCCCQCGANISIHWRVCKIGDCVRHSQPASWESCGPVPCSTAFICTRL